MTVTDKKSKEFNKLKLIEDSFDQYLPSWIKLKDKFIVPTIVTDQTKKNSLHIDFSNQSITVPSDFYENFEEEVIKLAGWIFLLSLFLSKDISIDISFSLQYLSLENKDMTQPWLTGWKATILEDETLKTNTNLFNIIPWSKEKDSELPSNALLDLIKLALNTNLRLDARIITNYIHSSILKLISKPKLSVMETLQLVMINQTDNATNLVNHLEGQSKAHSTITRHLHKLYEDALLLKRYYPSFDLCGFANIHMLVGQQKNTRKNPFTEEPWFFSLIQGYGQGLLQYYQFLTPNNQASNAVWKDLAKYFAGNPEMLILERIKETELLFSNYLWLDAASTWNLEKDIIDSIADQFVTNILSDEQLEFSGRKITNESITLEKEEYKLINAIIKARSITQSDVSQFIESENVRKVSDTITELLKTKKIVEVYIPSYFLLPERIILFLQTDLVSYDSFHDFLAILPYVKIDTMNEMRTGNLFRIVSIFTPIGYCDTILRTIVEKFSFNSIKILRPFDYIGTNWMFPINNLNEQNNWEYDWDAFKRIFYSLVT